MEAMRLALLKKIQEMAQVVSGHHAPMASDIPGEDMEMESPQDMKQEMKETEQEPHVGMGDAEEKSDEAESDLAPKPQDKSMREMMLKGFDPFKKQRDSYTGKQQ